MPTLIRFSNCAVVMYAADHLPPHFHVRIARRELSEVLQWAVAHQVALAKKWEELNS